MIEAPSVSIHFPGYSKHYNPMFQTSGKIIQRTHENKKNVISRILSRPGSLFTISLIFGFIILKVSVYFLVATVQRKCSTIVKKLGHKRGVYLNDITQFISVTVLQINMTLLLLRGRGSYLIERPFWESWKPMMLFWKLRVFAWVNRTCPREQDTS